MDKIGIIIPYFGVFPQNIEMFLKSCSQNKTIDWLIFTDQPVNEYVNMAVNVRFYPTSLEKVKEKIEKITKYKICLEKPYKLCDYKPLYGAAFQDYLKEYQYWGYSDMDVVYGDLRKFIQIGIDNCFEKIGDRGHFTLIHNDYISNSRYKLPIIKQNHKIFLFKDYVSKTNKSCYFDEGNGLNKIYDQYNLTTYTNQMLVNELLFENLDLYTNNINFISNRSCFIWNNGKAIYYYVHKKEVKSAEFGYFHFQKRKVFSKFIKSFDTSIFSITTLGYTSLGAINSKTIELTMNMNRSKFVKRLNYLTHWYFRTNTFTNKHVGSLYLPVRYILWRIFVRRDFKI